MKFSVAKSAVEKFDADLVAIGLFERTTEDKGAKGGAKKHALIKHVDGGLDLDRALGGEISKQIAAEGFAGSKGTERLLFTAGRIPARFVLIIGLGPRKECGLDVIREAGATLARKAWEVGAASAAIVLERGTVDENPPQARAKAFAEGVVLGAYKFEQYKSEKENGRQPLGRMTLLYAGSAEQVRGAIDEGRVIAEAQNLARDLVNIPGNDLTPRDVASRARAIARKFGLACTVMGPDAIKREKMGGLMAVSRGSAEPATFTVLGYKPKGRSHGHVALVGKGITFDAGGISLKPPRNMDQMKGDMAGAAAVIAAMQAIAQLKPKVRVTGFIPASENMPDGKAVKPGDVIRMRNGKTVEITNTDAEGRLVLADALSYASGKRPDAIVDLATLTGGALYCCGELYSLVMATDQKLADRLKRSGEAAGEPMWQLPMVEEYKKGYTSGIADLNNTGKSKAQTIMGALFLREFVGEDIPWAHLDIAASAWTDDQLPTSPKGATGAPVRTLVEFVTGFKGA